MLVVVLGVLAILTVLTLSFGHRALLDRRAAVATLDHAKALQRARGAVTLAIAELQGYQVKPGAERVDRNAPAIAQVIGTRDVLALGTYFTELRPGERADDVIQYTIKDEERRISINAADEAVLNAIPGLSFTVSRAIVRRRARGIGNRQATPFMAVEEVRLLDGVDDDRWLGDADELGLAGMLTIWGDGLINVNTAPEAVLQSVPDIDPRLAGAMIAYRRGPDGQLGTDDDQFFESWDQIAAETQVSAERVGALATYCKLDSQFFTITGFATSRQQRIQAYCQATVFVQDNSVEILQWREGPLGS